MIAVDTLLLFTLASAAIVIVPGPTVTVIVANSLRHGAAAGLYNVLGTQIGLLLMLGVLLVGLFTLIQELAGVFEVVRIVGAAYLVWLGISILRASSGNQDDALEEISTGPPAVFIRQGLLVILSNPKALFFFGAFLPQFVDVDAPVTPQLLLLGATFMLVGTVFDSLYALLAGRAGHWLQGHRRRWVERGSGIFLIGGGIWLLLMRPAESG